MNKEIKYTGHSASPSDYECADGELSLAMDLWQENGSIRPVLKPGVVLELASGYKVAHLHETAAFKHYIVFNESTLNLYWIDDSDRETLNPLSVLSFNQFRFVNTIGNTLIVFCANENHYFLWKQSDTQGGPDEYAYLSDHLPDLELSFGLVGHPRLYSVSDSSHDKFTVEFDESISEGALRQDFSEANQNAITEQIMAKVNKFINEQVNWKGYFCFPFFVRYALRLYDGSLTKHSAPILMCPSTKNAVTVLWDRASGSGSYSEAECDILLMAASLDYGSVNAVTERLSYWSDIVKSVDVFVSRPIYTYDQEGKILNLRDTDNLDTKFIGKLFHKLYDAQGLPVIPGGRNEDCLCGNFGTASDVRQKLKDVLEIYSEWPMTQVYPMYFNYSGQYPAESFHLPEFSQAQVRESLENCSNFFKLCSLDINDILDSDYRSGRKDIVVEEEYLQSLVNREPMTDDYLSHDRLYADKSFVYNQRINLAGVNRELFNGFSASSMFCYMSNEHTFSGDQYGKTVEKVALNGFDTSIGIYVKIKEGGRTYVVRASSGWMGFWHSVSNRKRSYGAYIFYPNTNAVMARIVSSNYGYAYDVQLRPHDFLNGAYALLEWDIERLDQHSGVLTLTSDNLVDNSNKLFTSEVDNPFFFPVTNINTVGTGRILAISTAARALSQGQFGQFPLYAFTTDGVWAMEVSAATGGFSAKQPITRDVILSGDSLAQIDSSVIFATDRGIMLISGSQTQCISEVIDGRNEPVFSLDSLPHARELLVDGENDASVNMVPFRTFLNGCRMMYDYSSQRIIVFNPLYGYAYIFSMGAQLWSMMRSNVVSYVNSYPECLAMSADGKLLDFSQRVGNETPANQILVTRPMKLDAPDMLKTVRTVIQRGGFERGNVKTLLYGSRDLLNWFPVFSSTDHFLRGFSGTPYKYYRIALKCSLADDESIRGCSVEFIPKETDQMR